MADINNHCGQVLVLGNPGHRADHGPSGGVSHIYDGATDITTQLAAGEGQLGGLLETRDTDIPAALASLDTLANAVGTAVNTANEAGTDANGNAGGRSSRCPPRSPVVRSVSPCS